MLSFEQARDKILENVAPTSVETVDLLDAAGCVIAENIVAPWAMPQWDNSAMDGFAVRAADCSQPTELEVVGYIPAGVAPEQRLKPGTAIRIMTGAPVPEGADAVIPIEDTQDGEEKVGILEAVVPGQHIRVQGEDVRAGEMIIAAGTLLRPAEVGMLASFGKTSISVYRRPRVAIVSTGDELVEPGTTPAMGQIINSNSFSLAAAIKEAGALPVIVGIARDDLESHRKVLAEGLKADALITSAGVSAGDRDLVRDVLGELGVEQLFWKINIKPGRPTAFALSGDKPVFSLPGNPVSAMITFEELVRPALLKMMGHSRLLRPTFKARLKEDAKKKQGRLHFLRVELEERDGTVWATTSGDQNTGILKTMVRARALAYLPAEFGKMNAGDEVDVHLV